MTGTANRIFYYGCFALWLVATAGYAYWQEPGILLGTAALILAFLLIQHPRYAFYLLMVTIPWSTEFNFNQGLGTDLPDEPLMLLAGLSLLFYFAYRWRSIQLKKLHPLVIIVGFQLIWTIVTVLTSTGFVLSVKYLAAKCWYLLAFLALPLVLSGDERFFKRSVLLLLSSMMAVTAVIVIRHGMNGWSFEKVNDAVKPFFRNHVNYSSLLVFMVPLQVAVIQLSSSKKIRWIFYCLLAATAFAIYSSYARGAWLALVAGIAAYWLLRKRLLASAFLLLLAIVVIGVFWLRSNERYVQFSNDYKTTIFHKDFRQHVIATYQLKDLSNAERIYRWVAGIRMLGDSWKTGFGPSTFYHQYKEYTLPAFKTYVSANPEQSTVHNYFLLLLIEQGVMGCSLFILLIAAMCWYAQKIYFRSHHQLEKVMVSATASILVMQCVINFLSDMIETDKVGSVFYLCIASLIIADEKTRMNHSDPGANVERIPQPVPQ